MDVLKMGKTDVSSLASKAYAAVTVHAPWLFHFLYRVGEKVSTSGGRSPVFYANTLYADGLYSEICRINPDVIVCTHIFSAQAVTYIREKYAIKTPAVGVATDYTCIPFWEESALDRYIIPCKALAGEFAGKGIPAEKLVPLGIPVDARFQSKTPKRQAREKFGLYAKHVFVVMSGSMGFGNIGRLANALLAAVPDSQVAAVCGSNKRQAKALAGMTNIIPFGYINDIDILMDCADVVLTKPGGLSSTEAISKRIPTVLTRPIPGCESQNAEYLDSIGAAVFAKSEKQAAEAALQLITDRSAAAEMLAAQNKYIAKDADRKIGDYLIALAKSSKKGGLNGN